MQGYRRALGLLVAVVPAVLAIIVLARPDFEPDPPPLDEYLAELRECFEQAPRIPMPEVDATRHAMSMCASDLIYRATYLYGPERSTFVMRELMRLEPRFDDCHVVSHEIAHAVALTGDEQRLMDSGILGECGWGYYDGAVMALVEMNPGDSDAEIAARAKAFCDLFPRDDPNRPEVVANCYHGMGHVYWDRHFPDVEASFEACALIDAPAESGGLHSGAAQCAGGAAMSLAEAMMFGVPVIPVLEHPSMICPLLIGEMHSQCLQYTAYDDIVHRGDDPEGFLDWCVSVEGLGGLARSECVGHAATYIGRSARFDLAGLCEGLPSEESSFCVSRIIQNHVFYRGPVGVDEFCDARPDVCAREPRVVEEARAGNLFFAG